MMKLKFNTPDFWNPIYYIVKFIGLAPFTIKEKNFYPSNYLDKLYPITLAIIYILGMAEALITQDMDVKFSSSVILKRMNSLNHFISFITFPCILVSFMFMQKRIVCLMNKLIILSYDIWYLGIEENYCKLAKNIFSKSLIVNILFIMVSVVLAFSEPGWPVCISIGHIIQEFLFLNMILIFVNILNFVNERFSLLNEKLYNGWRTVHNLKPSSHNLSRIFVTARDDRKDFNSFKCIRRIKVLHLENCNVMDQITRLFALPIIFLSCQYFVTLVVSCYWIYFALTDSNFKYRHIYIVCPSVRMVVIILEIFFIGCASRRACTEVKFIIHKYFN